MSTLVIVLLGMLVFLTYINIGLPSISTRILQYRLQNKLMLHTLYWPIALLVASRVSEQRRYKNYLIFHNREDNEKSRILFGFMKGLG